MTRFHLKDQLYDNVGKVRIYQFILELFWGKRVPSLGSYILDFDFISQVF